MGRHGMHFCYSSSVEPTAVNACIHNGRRPVGLVTAVNDQRKLFQCIHCNCDEPYEVWVNAYTCARAAKEYWCARFGLLRPSLPLPFRVQLPNPHMRKHPPTMGRSEIRTRDLDPQHHSQTECAHRVTSVHRRRSIDD